MKYYAEVYDKNNYPNIESVGKDIAYYYLDNLIPEVIEKVVDYEALVDMLNVQVIDTEDNYIVLCEEEFADLEENMIRRSKY